MQADITIAFPHGVNKRHAENGSGTGGHTDADVPGKPGLSRGEDCIVCVAERQLRLGVKSQSGAGGRHATRGALQQANSEFVFQAGHLLAECRNPNIEIERRATHAAGFYNANKIA